MIRTLIFDLGNVVLTNDWHDENKETLAVFTDKFGVDEKGTEKAWDSVWPKYRIGKITEDEYWRQFLTIANAKVIDVKIAKELWRKSQKPIEDMLALLAKLKKNYQLGALTTISREFLDYKIKRFSLDEYFETIVSSGYSGLHKPDPKIYQIILKKLKAVPKNSVFVDDWDKALIPAAAIGINTILFKNQKQLENDLKSLEVKIL